MPLDDYVSTAAPVGQSATNASPQKGKSKAKKSGKDEILVNPTMKDIINEDELNERAVTVQQRRKRAMQMRRLSSRLARARKLSRSRSATPSQLERRAYKKAKQNIRRRVAGSRGAEYQDLSAAGKYAVDVLVDPKVKNIQALVKRIMPKVRQADMKRLAAVRAHKKYTASPIAQMNSLDYNDFNRLYEEAFRNAETQQIDELSNETLKSYVDKVATGPSRGTSPNGILKSIKAISGVNKAIKKQYSKRPVSESVDLNESFGTFMTARDMGIVAEGGFAMHPSVQSNLDESAADHLQQAAIAERTGKHQKAVMHRNIAAAIQRGDMTAAKTMSSQLAGVK